ncbi:hypothetical protein ACJX0J_017102, partial [Zea mays]
LEQAHCNMLVNNHSKQSFYKQQEDQEIEEKNKSIVQILQSQILLIELRIGNIHVFTLRVIRYNLSSDPKAQTLFVHQCFYGHYRWHMIWISQGKMLGPSVIELRIGNMPVFIVIAPTLLGGSLLKKIRVIVVHIEKEHIHILIYTERDDTTNNSR